MTAPHTDHRDVLRQQIAALGMDSALTRRLVEAVDLASEEEVARVSRQLQEAEEGAPALLAELRAARAQI